MRFAKFLVAGALVAIAGLSAAPAQALSYTGVCPSTSGHVAVGGGQTGVATDCNLLIIFNADGSVTSQAGPQVNYDGSDDALIGVINLSSATIVGFTITGSGIFGFEGSGGTSDGIDGYVTPAVAINSEDAAHPVNSWTGYGGPKGYFTNVSSTGTGTASGVVNFIGGIASYIGGAITAGVTAGTTYFSLEQSITTASLPQISGVVNSPEPASMTLFGSALAGLAAIRRRKRT